MPDDYDDDDNEDNSSVCSSLVVRNVATQQWDKHDDAQDEQHFTNTDNKSLNQHANNKKHACTPSSATSVNECSSLLSPTKTLTATGGVAKSASKYSVGSHSKKNGSIGASMTDSMQTITLDDNRSLQLPTHDCIRSPCSPVSDDPCFHLYQRDIPEILYAEKFDMHSTSNTAVNQTIIYGKAKSVLTVCVCTMCGFSCILAKCWRYLVDGQWWAIGAIVLCVLAVTLCVVYLCWLPKNVESSVGHQVPAVPYLSLINCLLLSFTLTVVTWSNLAKIAIVFVTGLLIYVVYGYWHSVENFRSANINISVTNEEFHDNNCIINNPQLEQTSLSANNDGGSQANGCNGAHRNSMEVNN